MVIRYGHEGAKCSECRAIDREENPREATFSCRRWGHSATCSRLSDSLESKEILYSGRRADDRERNFRPSCSGIGVVDLEGHARSYSGCGVVVVKRTSDKVVLYVRKSHLASAQRIDWVRQQFFLFTKNLLAIYSCFTDSKSEGT